MPRPTLKGSAQPAIQNNDIWSGSSTGTMATTCSFGGDFLGSAGPEIGMAEVASIPDIQSDEGITVKGSKSDQQFHTVTMGELEENSHVIIFRLKGETKKKGNPVTKPLVVKTKLQCPTCGRRWVQVWSTAEVVVLHFLINI